MRLAKHASYEQKSYKDSLTNENSIVRQYYDRQTYKPQT